MSRGVFFRSVTIGWRWDGRWNPGRVVDAAWRDGALHGETEPLPGEEIVEGGAITPPLAEPHVHLDAALLGAQAPNVSGTLREGIANWARLRAGMSAGDITDRARRTLRMYRTWGCTRVRTHVDTGSQVAVDALLALKHEFPELQVVAFPQEGVLTGPGRREAWERAVEAGCDAVGAIPHWERTHEEGWASVRLAFELAERHGRAVDLHCDETDDQQSRNLEVACALQADRRLPHVVAGHCTALASYPNPHAAKVIEWVAASGVMVVANPLDNVVLQGRYDGYPRRRGLTRIDELWAAGARVGIGHDSVMDPWYRLGTANLVDAAYMAVHVGHLTAEDAMRRAVATLWDDNHACWRTPPREKLWWPVDDPIEILRQRPKPRVLA